MSVTEAATRLNLSPASCGPNARFAECKARSARGRRHHVTIKDMNVTTAHDEPTQRGGTSMPLTQHATLEMTKAPRKRGALVIKFPRHL